MGAMTWEENHILRLREVPKCNVATLKNVGPKKANRSHCTESGDCANEQKDAVAVSVLGVL